VHGGVRRRDVHPHAAQPARRGRRGPAWGPSYATSGSRSSRSSRTCWARSARTSPGNGSSS
jgi:hypothetical protein